MFLKFAPGAVASLALVLLFIVLESFSGVFAKPTGSLDINLRLQKSDLLFPPGPPRNKTRAEYAEDLPRRIKRAWFPVKGLETKIVLVSFKVDVDGHMSDLKVIKSSGVPAVDAAALKAVQNAALYRHLPDDQPTAVTIDCDFDYAQYNGGCKTDIHWR